MDDRHARTDGGEDEYGEGNDRTQESNSSETGGQQGDKPAKHQQPRGEGSTEQPQGQDGRRAQNRGGQPQGQGGQRPQGQGGQQPQHGQPQGQPPQGGRPPAGQPSGGDGGISRRQLLIGGGAVVVVGGGFFLLQDSSSSASGAEGAVQGYVSAVDSGDRAQIESAIHQNAPMSGAAFEISEELSYSVGSTEVAEQDLSLDPSQYENVQEFKAVNAEVSVSGETVDETSTAVFITAQNTNGEWKIWQTQ